MAARINPVCSSCSRMPHGRWFENKDGRFCKKCFKEKYPDEYAKFNGCDEMSEKDKEKLRAILDDFKVHNLKVGDRLFVKELRQYVLDNAGIGEWTIQKNIRALHDKGFIRAHEEGWEIVRLDWL